MKNFKKTIPFLILLAIGVGILTFRAQVPSKKVEGQSTIQELKTTLNIDTGSDIRSFDVSGFIGKTVLEATRATAGQDLKISGSGANAFIASIDSRVADSKKREFWELVINGKPAEVGAGSYIIQAGDQLQWHINTY